MLLTVVFFLDKDILFILENKNRGGFKNAKNIFIKKKRFFE